MKKHFKRTILQILLLIISLILMTIVYSLIYTHSANASKIPLKTEIITLNTVEDAKDTAIPPPKKQPSPVVATITTSATITVKGENQIDGEGILSDTALVNNGKKTAFLTFDDGPSLTVTPLILDILKKYKVKGTFFLIGKSVDSDEQTKNLVKQIFRDGHAIGNHTYTHNSRLLYPNNILDVKTVMAELIKTETLLENILGSNFDTKLVRLPGGLMSRSYYKDPNINLLVSKLHENNLHTIDWTASILDAEGAKKNSTELLDALKTTARFKQKLVILMHDTYGKEETAKALPEIIEYLKANGYEFKTLK